MTDPTLIRQHFHEMMQRPDAGNSGEDEGFVWRTAMAVLWPVRMLLRGLLFVFWTINAIAETIFGAAARAIRPAGSAPLLLRSVVSRDDGADGFVLRFQDVAPEAVEELTAWTARLPHLASDPQGEPAETPSIVSEVVEEA